jgi:hypothetical protein
MTDKDIDLFDTPALAPEMFARAVVRRGLKPVTRKPRITLSGTTGISMGEIANSNWFLRAAGFQTHSLPSLCFL